MLRLHHDDEERRFGKSRAMCCASTSSCYVVRGVPVPDPRENVSPGYGGILWLSAAPTTGHGLLSVAIALLMHVVCAELLSKSRCSLIVNFSQFGVQN